jgi:hypothetical protein
VAGGGFQEVLVQSFAWAFLISQEISRNRTMADGSRFHNIARKESGNLG